MINKIVFSLLMTQQAFSDASTPNRRLLQVPPANPPPGTPANPPPPPIIPPPLAPPAPPPAAPAPPANTAAAPCPCPFIYAPVCGTDGQVYGNECMATCINIPVAYPGICTTSAPPAPSPVPPVATPAMPVPVIPIIPPPAPPAPLPVAPQTTARTIHTSAAPAPGTTAGSMPIPPVIPPVAPPAPPVVPVIPAPAPPAPGTTAAAPIPVPVVTAPLSPAPTTLSPTMTPRPTTAMPTMNPLTVSPTSSPTMAPLPPGFQYGSWSQVCPTPAGQIRECEMRGQVLQSDTAGNIKCENNADCCMCNSIICGSAFGPQAVGCQSLMAGDYGVYGVKQIGIIGDITNGRAGAMIDCMGTEACALSNIFADSAAGIFCNVERSCADAIVQVDNPAPLFTIDCNGPRSCKGLQLLFNIGTPPPEGMACNPSLAGTQIFRFGGLLCNDVEACRDLELTINNRGCQKVIIESIGCEAPDGCYGADFALVGDVDIETCHCGPSCAFVTGLDKCFKNIDRFLCPDIESCMGMQRIIYNPMDLFYLECGASLSCAGAQFTIELTYDNPNPVNTIEALKFGGSNAGRGTTVTINNQQLDSSGQPVYVRVERVECTGINSCVDATFITGDNVHIANVVCGTFEMCLGCRIKANPLDVGRSCDGRPIRPITPVQPIAPINPGPGNPPPPFMPISPFVPAPPRMPMQPVNQWVPAV